MSRESAGGGSDSKAGDRWAQHQGEWRDPLEVTAGWQGTTEEIRALLDYRVYGDFWSLLAATGNTLFVSREYEHLVIALSVQAGVPRISFMRLPHPSGIAYDDARQILYLACTRNPNQIMSLRPVSEMLARGDAADSALLEDRPLLPVSNWYLPGCLYLHDLAMMDGKLHGNAVGHNAVVQFEGDGRYRRVWWPKAAEVSGEPVFGLNHLQLNSIAAGPNLEQSYFSASGDRCTSRRPGHRNYPVDGRGVIFSGATREVYAGGLTRPHSARLHHKQLWVLNSGYGELCLVEPKRCTALTKLPGWTRGLAFRGKVAFVGTSRVIPRFRQYAPGLSVDHSRCGIHAIDLNDGQILASLTWPSGNQIFALEWVPQEVTCGFPFLMGRRKRRAERDLFYAFRT